MEKGKTNTRRGKKATDESQAKFLTGERNVISSSPLPPLVPSAPRPCTINIALQ